MTKADLANNLWEMIVAAYHQHGRTKVEIPADDVITVLISLVANVLSQVPDAAARESVLRDMAPRVDRMVNTARTRTNIHLPSRPNLILPS